MRALIVLLLAGSVAAKPRVERKPRRYAVRAVRVGGNAGDEDKAALAGQPAPPSPMREALRQDGWIWLLYEVAAITVLALASMGLDRWRLRSLQNAAPPGTIPSADNGSLPSAVDTHGDPSKTSSTTPQGNQLP